MYRDTPYAQVPVHKYTPMREKTHVVYEKVVGTSKQEWMDAEESRYKRMRTERTKIIIITKRKLTYPM